MNVIYLCIYFCYIYYKINHLFFNKVSDINFVNVG